MPDSGDAPRHIPATGRSPARDWQAVIAGILADIQENGLLYASMPLVAALIGYGTKLAAIYMMFEPIRFVGIRPPDVPAEGFPANHSPKFFMDEAALGAGVRVLSRLAWDYLEAP
jgi:metal-dependent amidase/aminoacylase/carboxypeptidase family protein